MVKIQVIYTEVPIVGTPWGAALKEMLRQLPLPMFRPVQKATTCKIWFMLRFYYIVRKGKDMQGCHSVIVKMYLYTYACIVVCRLINLSLWCRCDVRVLFRLRLLKVRCPMPSSLAAPGKLQFSGFRQCIQQEWSGCCHWRPWRDGGIKSCTSLYG